MNFRKHFHLAILHAAALAVATPSALAQDVHVDITSAVAPGTGNVRLNGTPGDFYMIFFSFEESLTDLGDGIILLVDPIRAIQENLHIEGTIPAGGIVNFSFPTTAEWAGGKISFQGVTVGGATGLQITNLCRATFHAPNTFADAVGLPSSFSVLGDLLPQTDGNLLAIGGAGPVVQTYDTCLQQAIPSGLMSAGGYPLSSRTQLANGKILVAGGITAGLDGTGQLGVNIQTTTEAYLFDPADGTTTPTATPMTAARAGAAAVLLNNGKVIITGGIGAIDLANPASLLTGVLQSTELYDPATNAFVAGPSLVEGKAFHTATKLNNGNVLVAGGLAQAFGIPFISNLSYTYNASTNSFGFLPALFTGSRMFHSAVKLADGRVQLIGGITADLAGVLESGDLTQIVLGSIDTTAIFNPSSPFAPWGNGPLLGESRALHTATLLPGNKILVAGGLSGNLDIGSLLAGNLGSLVLPSATATSELVTPSTVTPGPTMGAARAGASAAVSPMDGRVIILGGGPLTCELYQP